MKASDLNIGEYGKTHEGILFIRTEKGYTCAYNHDVIRCHDLPFDPYLRSSDSLENEEYIVQYDAEIILVTSEKLEDIVKIAVINNKDVSHLTITRI